MNRIAALPYIPENYPGGEIRIGNWKEPLRKYNIEFDVFWSANKKEYERNLQGGLSPKNYLFHFKVLFQRLRILNKIRNYKVVWIQRNYIPFYPLNKPYFERYLSKSDTLLIVDYYDADYVQNEKLVNETARIANKVSVSSPFLLDYFFKINSKTYFLPMTLSSSSYLRKNYTKEKTKLIIGWMGSPENSIELKRMDKVLKIIESKYLNIQFEFLCRKKIGLSLERKKMRNWNERGFNYYKWVENIDIGIVPILEKDDVSLAKSPMKLLEFLCAGIATVSSPCGAYPKMIDGKHCLFAESEKDWIKHLSLLIESHIERKRLGSAGFFYFKENHSYENNVQTLLNIFNETEVCAE